MSEYFHLILTQPLLNLLIWLYNVIPGQDIGLAIIALTVLVRLVLYPSFQKSLKSQKHLQDIQPQDEIRARHKDDKEAQTKAIMEFYQKNKINPFSSCLPLLVQLPILLALFNVFRVGLHGDIANQLYGFVANPGAIDTYFLGVIDLAKPNAVLAVLAGGFQFVQSRMMTRRNTATTDRMAAVMNKQMIYLFPLLTVFIGLRFEAGLALYWIVTTLFAIGQQYYIMKKG